RRRFPQLFVQPWEAAVQSDWAAFETGVQRKRAPDELKRLLGWSEATSGRGLAKRLKSKLAWRSLEWTKRINDPAAHATNASLFRVREASPGELVRLTTPYDGLQSMDGPRFAWELETYLYGDGASTQVNPPDGPALDLAPREGATLLALAKHHPYRLIHYL